MHKNGQKVPVVRIAYFISSHGFGHGARAAAVMAQLRSLKGEFVFDIFTAVPAWFFEQSISYGFHYHDFDCDVGFCQTSSLVADIPATIEALDRFWHSGASKIDQAASLLKQLGCQLVVCDIAPLGIAAAKKAGLPSILIENFSWDWLYAPYIEKHPRLSFYADHLAGITARAGFHLQAKPVCHLKKTSDLLCGPIARRPRQDPAETRRKLGLDPGRKMVLISMGGIPADYGFLDLLKKEGDIDFVIPGGAVREVSRQGNLLLIPHQSRFWHPDLIAAADGVVGKVGYSTLAEIYHAQKPFGYICRPDFRESPVLADFIEENMCGLAISPQRFESGRFVGQVRDLLNLRTQYACDRNGAEKVAGFIESLTF